MAYVDPTQDPENQDENQSQVDQALAGTQNQPDKSDSTTADSSTTPPATSGGGGSGIVSSGTQSSAGAAPAASGKPTSSGSWVNLNSYLDANKDQGTDVGNTIAGSVDTLANTAQDSVNNLGSGFNQAVAQNTVNADSNAVQGAISGAQNLKDGQALDPDSLAAFNAQKNATYSGPTDVTAFAGYGDTNNAVNNANTAVQQTGSEAGRNTLLQNQYQNSSANGYNQGENNLDQLLLENSPGAQAALQPLQSKWANLNTALGDTVTAGNAAAQAGQATTAQTAQSAGDAATQAQQAYEQNLTSQEQQALAARNALISKYQGQTTLSNILTPDELAGSGLTNGQDVYNTDLKNYINGTTPTVGSYANLDQYAQDSALSQLAGGAGILNDKTQAGTANMGIFDKSLTPALQQAADQYQKNLTTPGTQIAPMKMPDGSMQDINKYFGDTGANGVTVNNIPLQNLAKQLGGTPQGASISDLQNKWIPALQALDQQQGGMAGNRGYQTLNEVMIKAIQDTITAWNQQQGLGTMIGQPLAAGGNTAHVGGMRQG